jgi:hypothetical protein
MIVGLKHRVGMTLHLTLSFDRWDRVGAVVVEPSDPGLFDHVVGTELSEHDPKPVRIPELSPEPQLGDQPAEGATTGRSRRHI